MTLCHNVCAGVGLVFTHMTQFIVNLVWGGRVVRRLMLVAFLFVIGALADTAAWSAVVRLGARVAVSTLGRLPGIGPRMLFGGGGGQATPAVTASMTAQIVNDVDGDGKADPGDTIRYTATIDVATAAATGVHFTD